MILTDELVDRVHRADIETFRRFSEAIVRAFPEAVEAPVGTGHGLFAAEGSPLTQVAGFAHRTPSDPEAIEAFFAGHAHDWEVGVTPFTDPSTVRALLDRGYRPEGFEGMLAQEVGKSEDFPQVEIVEVGPDLSDWKEASSRAWTENEASDWDAGGLVETIAVTPARNYVAYVDGVPAAAASMAEAGDAVLLRGGGTRVPYRGRGLQTALIARRLRDAGRGRLAMIGAEPGSASYRNAQRAGFTPLYSTLTLKRRLS